MSYTNRKMGKRRAFASSCNAWLFLQSLPLELTDSCRQITQMYFFCVVRTSLRILPDMLAALLVVCSIETIKKATTHPLFYFGTHRDPPPPPPPPLPPQRCEWIYKTKGAGKLLKRWYGAHPPVVTLGGVKTSSRRLRLTCTVRLKTGSNMASYLTANTDVIAHLTTVPNHHTMFPITHIACKRDRTHLSLFVTTSPIEASSQTLTRLTEFGSFIYQNKITCTCGAFL